MTVTKSKCYTTKRREMTGDEVNQLVRCPDCRGDGYLITPSRNWNKHVICGRCHGRGYVRKDAA